MSQNTLSPFQELSIPLVWDLMLGRLLTFATPDWISHGSTANEQYRGVVRQAFFSHDRLTFTMAQFLEEHSLESCGMLKRELSRVIEEEQRLRSTLLSYGVRDVSQQIKLPPNLLDQLDEESADYDNKRLCHYCSHICFFSTVACECSQSKVSCLRHSHFMCRCNPDKKYLLVWASTEEMNKVLKAVEGHCMVLSVANGVTNVTSAEVDSAVESY